MKCSWHRLLLGLSLLVVAVIDGQAGGPSAEQLSLPFTGDGLPQPPQQKTPWTAPKTTLPPNFVAAVTLLFEQGMADPRGCEYRQIGVMVGETTVGHSDIVRTHGWVFSGKRGDRFNFAVCWDGLVYPLAELGDVADVRADVQAVLEAAQDPTLLRYEGRRYTGEGHSVWYEDLDLLQTGLLLRFGEVALAEKLWKVLHRPRKGESQPNAEQEGDYYLTLADQWAEAQFELAVSAHLRGDDGLALARCRQLSTFAEAARPEMKKRLPEAKEDDRPPLAFLAQLPQLLADQESRHKQARNPVVCIGRGKEPNQAKRIAALIDRLDEVTARQTMTKGGVEFWNDTIVRALVREGEPAVEPLLACLENDQRLTRSVLSRDYLMGVHWAADAVLAGILGPLDFAPVLPLGQPQDVERNARKARAVSIRAFHQKNPGKTPADYWFGVLADDTVYATNWLSASSHLVWPGTASFYNGTLSYGPQFGHKPSDRGKQWAIAGELLRRKQNPSLTELFLKRIGQLKELDKRLDMTRDLTRWDAKAAVPVLTELAKGYHETGDISHYVELLEARVKADDQTALNEYVAWICTLNPSGLRSHAARPCFRLMWLRRDHPGIAEAADALFADQRSPWVGWFREEAGGGLLATPLLYLPAFRKLALALLANKADYGQVTVAPYRQLSIQLPRSLTVQGWRSSDPLLPEETVTRTFRTCDYAAWLIGTGLEGAPRCELYWPEAMCDVAVATCAAFVERYGERVVLQEDVMFYRAKMPFPALDQPATKAQAQSGAAIFSLEGEGTVRTAPLGALPIKARWVALKDQQYQERTFDRDTGKWVIYTGYHQHGLVYQAEEVFKDGVWQRFYGFVGSHHIDKVPAADIEFPPQEPNPSYLREWAPVAEGIDGHLDGPLFEDDSDEQGPLRLPSNSPLAFRLSLWNHSGLDRHVPDLKAVVSVKLAYSPEKVSRQGVLVPAAAAQEGDWDELPLLPTAGLSAEASKRLPAAQ
jgi:hypothetical protein